METVADPDCVYVSVGSGVHDLRWLSALRRLGHHPVHIERDRYVSNEDFREAVRITAASGIPVIAGPLDIALSLIHATDQVVFLSWGFDLQEAASDLDLSIFTAVIVDSAANERVARESGASRIINIPWGIDIEAIDSDASVADLSEYGIDPDEPILLSLRAHESRYRVSDILEAFARRPRTARLVIGNSGSLTDTLRQLAADLDVDAAFIPSLPEDRIPSLLRRASAYVTASEVDGTSVTLLQAMACHVPIAASANSGNVDWIDDGVTGFLFPIANIDALNTAIDRVLLANPAVTQAARTQVEQRANWNTNIENLRPVLSLEGH